MDGPRIRSSPFAIHQLLPSREETGTYADSTTVHHGLIFRLNRTRVMEDHDHTFESLDRYSSASYT
jgi:hypothetical protein